MSTLQRPLRDALRRFGGLVFAAWVLVTSLATLAGSVVVADEAQPSHYGRDQFDESDREHWAFWPPQRPDVPPVKDAAWVTTPVDAFILAQLEAAGIEPAPRADRRTLLRRVYLDLIGLPPTPDEQRAFLADDSTGAWQRVVDDLLSRPEYGERWARHWLDVVRYAESNGYERDGGKPNVWRYRDWVIDAFNRDMPYDQFVIDQLAGDEIDRSDAAAQIATTFLRLGPWDDEPADPLVDRYDQLDDVLGTTAAAFMGLTIRCARCHDHKFEPFTQSDYARLLAVFEPLVRPQNGRTELDREVGTAEELAAYHAATAEADAAVAERREKLVAATASVCERLFGEGRSQLPPEAIAAFQAAADQRSDEQKKLVGEHRKQLDEEIAALAGSDETARWTQWEREIAEIDAARPPAPPRAYIFDEKVDGLPVTSVFHRGNPRTPGDEVAPGVPAILVDAPLPPPARTERSSGRRLQFARWLARADHPLTARVMVNRIWQHHFGEGLVASENDFGLMGLAPTHPELLDWLAVAFADHGWSIKHIHRLIVLSSTYRLSTTDNDEARELDPDVELLWRWRSRRLEAEVIRDSMLAISGQLNPAAGGPSIYPQISAAVLATQSRPGNGWGNSSPNEAARRSIYIYVKRTLGVPEMEVLDFPNTNASCEQRMVSTIAPQALTLFNGEFMHQQAGLFAERLVRETGTDPAAQVERAFELAFCREPTDDERTAVLGFLDQQTAQILADRGADRADADQATEARRQALSALCLVLLNTNEIAYTD